MMFPRRIWSNVNRVHATILLSGIAMLCLAAIGVLLGLEVAGWLAVPGLVIVTFYWWGGMIDLVDTGDSLRELGEQSARKDED